MLAQSIGIFAHIHHTKLRQLFCFVCNVDYFDTADCFVSVHNNTKLIQAAYLDKHYTQVSSWLPPCLSEPHLFFVLQPSGMWFWMFLPIRDHRSNFWEMLSSHHLNLIKFSDLRSRYVSLTIGRFLISYSVHRVVHWIDRTLFDSLATNHRQVCIRCTAELICLADYYIACSALGIQKHK